MVGISRYSTLSPNNTHFGTYLLYRMVLWYTYLLPVTGKRAGRRAPKSTTQRDVRRPRRSSIAQVHQTSDRLSTLLLYIIIVQSSHSAELNSNDGACKPWQRWSLRFQRYVYPSQRGRHSSEKERASLCLMIEFTPAVCSNLVSSRFHPIPPSLVS